MKIQLPKFMRSWVMSTLSMSCVFAADYTISGDTQTVKMSDICNSGGNADSSIEMTAGEFIADANVNVLKADGGLVRMQDAGVNGELRGSTSVYVDKGLNNTLGGNNSYTGDTEITGSKVKLKLMSADALGASTVYLSKGAELIMNSQAIENNIVVRPGNSTSYLSGAENYKGDIYLDAGVLRLKGDTTANKVTMSGANGYMLGGSITLNTLEILPGSSYIAGMNIGNYVTYTTDITINPNGQLIMYNGKTLAVTGSLTMGSGSSFVLNGEGYEKGTVIATATNGIVDNGCKVVLVDGYGTAVVQDGKLVLTNIFNQQQAEVSAINNWGLVAASRTFVNAIRGQHDHMGCVANGRGSVWAAVLGAYQDISDSEFYVRGAAIGADVHVGNAGLLGFAVGYVDGDVQPVGLPTAEQHGSYLALYGGYDLLQLSSNGYIGLEWTAAYGRSESEVDGVKWNQDSVQLNTRVSWHKMLTSRFRMSVFGGVEYYGSESDASAGVKSGSVQNLRVEIGGGVKYVVWRTCAQNGGKASYDSDACDKLVLHGELRYMNDLVRSNPVIRMDGLSGEGENPGRQGVGIEAGATYRIGERWSASANYGFSAMVDFHEHRVNVGAGYTF